MKRSLIVFLRVIFVLFLMMGVAFFALRFYFQHQSQKAIDRAVMMNDTPVIGAKDLPFSIVEFFDYRCQHCAAMSKLVAEATEGDTQTKIILRPVVLGDPESYKIASLVLAADAQKVGATLLLHRQIMDITGLPTYDMVKAMAEAQGIDVKKAETDVSSEMLRKIIAHNTMMVQDIGFYGVPALVIGDKGFIPRGELPGVNELRLMIIDAKTRLKLLK